MNIEHLAIVGLLVALLQLHPRFRRTTLLGNGGERPLVEAEPDTMDDYTRRKYGV